MTDQALDAARLGHTPGPWKVLHLPHLHQWKVSTASGAPVQGVIAAMDRKSVKVDESTQEANARLIAAAPDLLAALVDIEDACGFAQGDIDTGDYRLAYDKVTEARHEARAAIAKARGE